MENTIYYNALYDYYANLLTDTQKDYYEAYYFHNLSLTEIADNYQVSKNAISKTLKEVINKLLYYEDKLKLYTNKEAITKLLNEEELIKIDEYI